MTTPIAKHVRRTPHAMVVHTQQVISTVLATKRIAEQSGIHGVQMAIGLPAECETAFEAMQYIYRKLQEDKHTNCAFNDANRTITINLT